MRDCNDSQTRTRTVLRSNRYKLRMLHTPQGTLVTFERKVKENIMVRNLRDRFLKTSREVALRKAHLRLLRQRLQHRPCLLSRPRKRLRILCVLAERVLP